MFDYIIIGAGIAGLYCAYNIKKRNPNAKYIILESSNYIGGRIGIDYLEGTSIVTGAGIGRKKDKYLIELLKELRVEYNEFTTKFNYSNIIKRISIDNSIIKLKLELLKYDSEKYLTFKEFAIKVLGKEEYKNFIINIGYRDFENEDPYSVLYDYNLADNYISQTALSINWDLLLNKLCNVIGIKNIKTNNTVYKIVSSDSEINIYTEQTKIYSTKKLILATTIESINKLLKNPIYKIIKSQPFLRIYAQFNKSSIEIMKQYVPYYTVVSSWLYKIIPINPNKGIYMIAYTDNVGAINLLKNIENIGYFEKIIGISLDIKNSLKIDKIKYYYWKIGTHYFKPYNHKIINFKYNYLKTLQHPEHNIYVVGECVSMQQGWVEGALSSVQRIIKKI